MQNLISIGRAQEVDVKNRTTQTCVGYLKDLAFFVFALKFFESYFFEKSSPIIIDNQ